MSPRAHLLAWLILPPQAYPQLMGVGGVGHKQSLTLPQARVHAHSRSGPEASILIIYLSAPGPRTQSRTRSLPPEALYKTVGGKDEERKPRGLGKT